MALVPCGECGRQISDRAAACPHCGAPGRGGAPLNNATMMFRGYEYKSKTTFFGLPLIHVATGYNPETGSYRRVARGVIAIGDIALGGLAVGGVAIGGISVGGMSLGLAALGGLAVGAGLAVGGAAIGSVAIGGAAVGYYALGGGAFGEHVVSGMRHDAEAIEFFRAWFGIDLGLR